jgi:hypothetical protein
MRLIWLLLLVPYAGLLWVAFYNKQSPELLGSPFLLVSIALRANYHLDDLPRLPENPRLVPGVRLARRMGGGFFGQHLNGLFERF